MADHHTLAPDAHRGAHADDDDQQVNVGAIFATAAGLVLSGILIYGLIWLLFAYFSSRQATHAARQYPLAAARESRLPPEPRLQTTPRQDMQDLRAQEDALLTGYSWADRNAGTVRIPIDVAMRLTLERGLPARRADKESGR